MICASSSKKLIVAILASCLVGLQMAPPSCAEEQKSEWQLHMDASLQALNSSDFKSAEQEIGVAEKLGLETPNDGRYALALLLHAQIYAKLERFADAEATIKKARENFTQSLGADSPLNAIPAFALGNMYALTKKYGDALKEFNVGFALVQPVPGISKDSVLQMSQTLVAITNYSSAEPGLEKTITTALGGFERMGLTDDPMYGALNCALADIYVSQSKFQEAETLYRTKSGNAFGSNPELAKIALSAYLVRLYMSWKRLQAAETVLNEALALSEKINGDNAVTVGLLVQKGQLLKELNRIDDAEASYKKALAIADKANDAKLASLVPLSLSFLYFEKEDYVNAEAVAKRGVRDLEKADFDPVTQLTMSNVLTTIYTAEGKYIEAEAEAKRGLAMAQQKLPGSKSMADEYYQMGEIYYNQGRYQQATENYEKALAVHQSAVGNSAMPTLRDMLGLAMVAQDQKQYPKSDRLFNDILHYANADANPEFVATVLARSARSQTEQKQFVTADSLLQRALVLDEKASGADSEDAAATMIYVARNKMASTDYSGAEEVLRKALAIFDKKGTNKAKIAATLELLVKANTELGQSAAAKPFQVRLDEMKTKLPSAPPAAIAENPVITVGGTSTVKSDQPVKAKWALVIGISNFKDTDMNLKYAAKDAKDFAQYLTTEGNFDKDHVKLLVDQDASRQNIVDALGDGWLGAQAKPDDLVVIYVSSHGGADMNKASGLNFLASYDANAHNLLTNGIPMEWFSQIIKEQIHCKKVVVFLDVCHSGAATGNKGISRERNFDATTMQPGTGQIIVCSSLANQLSWESRKYPNSVFTKQLIEGLKSKGAHTTLSEAFESMREKVETEVLEDRHEEQTPVMKRTWNGDDLKLSAPQSMGAL